MSVKERLNRFINLFQEKTKRKEIYFRDDLPIPLTDDEFQYLKSAARNRVHAPGCSLQDDIWDAYRYLLAERGKHEQQIKKI